MYSTDIPVAKPRVLASARCFLRIDATALLGLGLIAQLPDGELRWRKMARRNTGEEIPALLVYW